VPQQRGTQRHGAQQQMRAVSFLHPREEAEHRLVKWDLVYTTLLCLHHQLYVRQSTPSQVRREHKAQPTLSLFSVLYIVQLFWIDSTSRGLSAISDVDVEDVLVQAIASLPASQLGNRAGSVSVFKVGFRFFGRFFKSRFRYRFFKISRYRFRFFRTNLPLLIE